jgi:gliding motility-associated-like protein
VGNQQIAAAKALTSLRKINATTFQSVYSFNVANLGTFIATNVQLVDNLNTTFPSPITYTVVGVNAASPLTPNLGYNGNTNIALLSGSDMLGVAQNAIVTLTVNFSPNTTTLTGISNYGIASTSNDPDPTGSGAHSSTDTTQTGTNPDPDGDGNPNGPGENTPTVIGQQIAAAKSASELTKIDATTFQTVFTFNVNNSGPVVASNIQLVDNLNTTFPSPITYTVLGVTTSTPLTANTSYNGNTISALLSGSNTLNVSQNAIVTLTVNFSPNATTVTALSNYGIASTSNLPDPTGSGTHTSMDTTDAGSNTDFDGDGNPNELGENDPTYFGQQIGAAKQAVSSIKLANSDNQTTFVFSIQNLGVLPATNVQLKDNLNITFPSPITYTVTSLTSGGLLTTDATYNGSSNVNLLASSNTLAVGATETVTLVINFTMHNSSLTSLYNYGVAITLGLGGSSSSDTTQTGTNPDPDGDGKANEFGENTPTEFIPINDIVTNPEFSIPQGFSPNGDGVNDLFVIKGILNYPQNTFTILNRWGTIVYKMDGYTNTWNGKSSEGLRFGGDDLPDGTYFYILDLGNNEKPYKGFIYINKTIK